MKENDEFKKKGVNIQQKKKSKARNNSIVVAGSESGKIHRFLAIAGDFHYNSLRKNRKRRPMHLNREEDGYKKLKSTRI